jgi:IS1 family transposase
MNRLTREKQAQVIAALVEGNSVNSVVRMTGVTKVTILKLLTALGSACADFQDKVIRNLKCKRIQVDEVWQFVYSKQKNVPQEKRGRFGYGDVWVWVGIDADSKLIVSWTLGKRDAIAARILIDDLKNRLASRVQLTSDGLRVYIDAVEGAFGCEIDYAMLVKTYESSQDETRYSPAVCTSCERKPIMGNPDPKHISTSYIERQNLSMRMSMRRFTRLTNGFSKKVENHAYAVALYTMHYNFARIHQTLRCTPAMEAGVSDHVWSLEEVAALIPEPACGPRGPYKKKV